MIKIGKLDNGIRVVNDYMKDVETTTIKVIVKTGSRNETIENNGISHFIEHMAFKGTTNRTAKQIACDFESIGANFNAYTSKDTTAYYSKQLKEYTEQAFEILIDMIDDSIFSEEELERERGVILQELAMTLDTPDNIIYDYYTQTAFANQPYGRSILGPAENIKKFQQKDFLQYIEENYTINNIVVSVAGNIDFDKVLDMGNKYFLKKRKRSNGEIVPANYTPNYFYKNKELEQMQCIIGFKGLSYNDENKYKLSVMNNIFGSGMSSRLFQEVREKNGLCYTIYSYNDFTFDTGSFEIYTGVEPSSINKSIDSIIDVIKEFLNGDIKEEELNRAKIKIKSSLLMSMENTNSRASCNGMDMIKYGKVIDNKEIIESIDETTIDDVKSILHDIISTTPSVAIYGNNDNVYNYEQIKDKFRI